MNPFARLSGLEFLIYSLKCLHRVYSETSGVCWFGHWHGIESLRCWVRFGERENLKDIVSTATFIRLK